MQRQAHQEALQHLSNAIELLHSLVVTPERLQQELTLQLLLGVPLIATQGWTTRNVGQVYDRARVLCRQIGTNVQLAAVLCGLQVFHVTRAEYATARQLAELLLDLAQQAREPALLVGAHLAVGQTLFFIGEFAAAWKHLEQGLALHPEQHTYQSWADGHPGIQALGYGAWTLWFLGYPEQAQTAYRQRLQGLQKELEEARAFNDASRIEKLQAEFEFMTQEVGGVLGLRGRSRKFASSQERARVNVTRAIRAAITRVSEVHPFLGQCLTQTIKTGAFCSDVPNPSMPLTWEF